MRREAHAGFQIEASACAVSGSISVEWTSSLDVTRRAPSHEHLVEFDTIDEALKFARDMIDDAVAGEPEEVIRALRAQRLIGKGMKV